MNSTQIFMLDKLLKSLPKDALKQAKERLSDDLTEIAIEIADIVSSDDKFGLNDLIERRELLKIYVSRIDVQINILTNKCSWGVQ